MSLVLSKRFWTGVALMVLVLVGVNGICAFLMIGGVVDSHLTAETACLAWGISAAVIGWHTAKEKEIPWFQSFLIAAVVFSFALGLTVIFRGHEANLGAWWKCALCSVIGAALTITVTPAKKKKRVSYGTKGKKRSLR